MHVPQKPNKSTCGNSHIPENERPLGSGHKKHHLRNLNRLLSAASPSRAFNVRASATLEALPLGQRLLEQKRTQHSTEGHNASTSTGWERLHRSRKPDAGTDPPERGRLPRFDARGTSRPLVSSSPGQSWLQPRRKSARDQAGSGGATTQRAKRRQWLAFRYTTQREADYSMRTRVVAP